MPFEIKSDALFKPGSFGFEKEIKKRIDYWHKLRQQKRRSEYDAD